MRYLNIIIVMIILFTMHCDNPFLPPRPVTDRPIELIDLRHSPGGVIHQLIKAYEYRNIDLYTSLLASDFRFYVSSGFDKTEKKYTGSLEPEKPDTFMDYHMIDKASDYLYWNLRAEVNSTQNMFDRTRSIEIDLYQIDAPIYHCDSLYAEVVVSSLSLEIITVAGYEYNIVNQPQVFVLKRSELNGLKIWLIWKWYDLGSE